MVMVDNVWTWGRVEGGASEKEMIILLYLGFVAHVLLVSVAGQAIHRRRNRFGRMQARTMLTGAEAAQRLLLDAGVDDVQVRRHRKEGEHFFDSRKRRILLGAGIYDGCSVYALGVAAHEAGHAIEMSEGNESYRMREWVVRFGQSGLGMVVLVLPVLGMVRVLPVRIALFLFMAIAGVHLFGQMMTLSIEYAASRRVRDRLRATGICATMEEEAFDEVLKVAPLAHINGFWGSLKRLTYTALPRGRK